MFDRLLTTGEDRAAAIVPETATEAVGREFVTTSSERRAASPFVTVPKEPERLASYLRRNGGLADAGGDVRSMFGGAKYRPGLISSPGWAMTMLR